MIDSKQPYWVYLFNLLLFAFFFLPINSVAETKRNPNDPSSLIVWKINFEGNSTFSDVVLAEVIALKAVGVYQKWVTKNYLGFEYSAREVQKDVIRLKRFYQKRGFPDAKISLTTHNSDDWWKKVISFKIDEGKPIKISTIKYILSDSTFSNTINSSSNLEGVKKKQPLRLGKRFEIVRINEVEGLFTNELKNIGFPFANTNLKYSVDSAAYKANILIQLVPGNLAKIDSIAIVGKLSVPKSLILKEGELIIGNLYSQKALGNAQQELFNHHLFQFVTFSIPNQNHDSTISLLMQVREYPLRQVSLRGGVGTEEIVRAEAQWRHLNPFGNATEIASKIRSSLNVDGQIRQAQIGLDYSIPYLFNTHSSTQTTPFAEYRNEYSYTLVRYGITNSLLYQHSLEWQSSLGYEFTANRFSEKQTNEISRDSLELYNISSIQLSSIFRQGLINRYIKWYVNPYIEISGLLGTGTYGYEKYFLDLRRYLTLSPWHQLAVKFHFGFINVESSSDIPAAIRLYAGGTQSVRGWLTDDLGPKRIRTNPDGSFDRFVPTGGKATFAFSVELRRRLDIILRGLGFAAFIDGGQVWRSATDIDLLNSFNLAPRVIPGNAVNELQYGVGGGLSYNSPIGPIRLDIAYKINPTEADLAILNGQQFASPIRRWGIHFSVGHPF